MSSTDTTPTPRTDAAKFQAFVTDSTMRTTAVEVVHATTSANLERDVIHLHKCEAAIAKAHGQQEKQIASLLAERDALKAALEMVIEHGQLGNHAHWDMSMERGAGCPVCITQRNVLDSIRAALAQGRPSDR